MTTAADVDRERARRRLLEAQPVEESRLELAMDALRCPPSDAPGA